MTIFVCDCGRTKTDQPYNSANKHKWICGACRQTELGSVGIEMPISQQDGGGSRRVSLQSAGPSNRGRQQNKKASVVKR